MAVEGLSYSLGWIRFAFGRDPDKISCGRRFLVSSANHHDRCDQRRLCADDATVDNPVIKDASHRRGNYRDASPCCDEADVEEHVRDFGGDFRDEARMSTGLE